jgi:hypothetical protein
MRKKIMDKKWLGEVEQGAGCWRENLRSEVDVFIDKVSEFGVRQF